MSPTGWSLLIVFGIFLTLIAYIVTMYVLASQHLWFFSPTFLTPEPPTDQFIRPLGPLVPLTQQQIDERNQILNGEIAQLNKKISANN